MPRIGRGSAEGEIAPGRAAIKAEMVAIARTGRMPILRIEAGVAVARDRAEAPGIEHRGVCTEEEAAGLAIESRGIAVAIRMAPGAEALAPQREAISIGCNRLRHTVFIRDRCARRSQTVVGRAETDETAVLDQGRLRNRSWPEAGCKNWGNFRYDRGKGVTD